jgi:hypothetical protein
MKKLNATQVQKLLSEGYSWTDIALLEQDYLSGYPIHPSDKAFNSFVGDRIQGLADMPGNIVKSVKKNYKGSPVDKAIQGDWSGAGDAIVQNVKQAPARLAQGIKNIGSGIAGWFESKIAQGYPTELLERFSNSYFGKNSLTESSSRTRLTENNRRLLETNFAEFVNQNINEQWYKDAWDGVKDAGSEIGRGFKQLGNDMFGDPIQSLKNVGQGFKQGFEDLTDLDNLKRGASEVGKGFKELGHTVTGGLFRENTLGEWMHYKNSQGYPARLIERFADHQFGNKFLAENASSISRTRLNENDFRLLEKQFAEFTNEQYPDGTRTGFEKHGSDALVKGAEFVFDTAPEAIGDAASWVNKNAIQPAFKAANAVGSKVGKKAGQLAKKGIDTVKGWFESKMAQGYPAELLERFSNSYFGKDSLTESTVRTRLNENNIRLLEACFIEFINEQHPDGSETGLKKGFRKAVQATGDTIAKGAKGVKNLAKKGINKVKGWFEGTEEQISELLEQGYSYTDIALMEQDLEKPRLDTAVDGLTPTDFANTSPSAVVPAGGPTAATRIAAQAIGAVPGMAAAGAGAGALGNAVKAVTDPTIPALTKDENMTPRAHKQSIQDWTTNMQNRLLGEQNPWERDNPPMPRPPGPGPGPAPDDFGPRPPVPGPNPFPIDPPRPPRPGPPDDFGPRPPKPDPGKFKDLTDPGQGIRPR